MVYENWSFEMEMLIGDEWWVLQKFVFFFNRLSLKLCNVFRFRYLWDDFVHFVKYLSRLSFTYDRRSIRQHCDLSRSIRQIHKPFSSQTRFPLNQILVNTSFDIDLCLRRILSAIDIPDFTDYSTCSSDALSLYNKSKELYYYHLHELFDLTNFSDNLLAEKGVFNRQSFETRNSLKWKEPTINSNSK